MKHSCSHSKSGFYFTLLISGFALVTGNAPASVVDDFSQGALSMQLTNYAGQTVVQSGLDPTLVLGGSRKVYGGSFSRGSLAIETIKGRFNFSADADFGYFTLDWGIASPLNINLNAGGNNRFQINFLDVTPGMNLGIFDLSIESGNAWFTDDFSSDLFHAVSTSSSATITIPFSNFAGVNLGHMQAVELSVSRFQPTFRLSIDSISTVPEPAAISLFGLASALMLLTFRKREGGV